MMSPERVIFAWYIFAFLGLSCAIKFPLNEIRRLAMKNENATASPSSTDSNHGCDSEGTASAKPKSLLPAEIREKVIILGTNLSHLSIDIELGISRLKLQRHQIDYEIQSLMEKDKELSGKIKGLDKEIEQTRSSISSNLLKERQLTQQGEAESPEMEEIMQEIQSEKAKEASWYCILSCYQKFKDDKAKNIRNAQERYNVAKKKFLCNITSSITRIRTERLQLNITLANLTIEAAAVRSTPEETRKKLLERSNIRETIFTLTKNLSLLQLNLLQLEEALEMKAEYADDDIKFKWNATESTLGRIAAYFNDGGIVSDLSEWGIFVKGFDVDSVKQLGVDVDEATAALLGMS